MAVKTSFVYAVAVIVFTCVYNVYGQQEATPAPCTSPFGGQYQCNDGNGCYSDHNKCDSYNACADKSDDLNCDNCTDTISFYCPSSRQCMSEDAVCNDYQDCLNGEDEDVTFCSTYCKPGSGDYRCNDGNGCYSDRHKCDSYNRCNDKTDDLNCDSCSSYLAFYCLSSRQCVSTNLVCDGHQNCLNGEDEDVTSCYVHCLPNYQCNDGNGCYSDYDKCNSFNACNDKTDELDCDSCDNSGAFYCRLSRQCVPTNTVCDGRQDCLNGEDENLPECNPTIWMYWSGGQMAGIVIGYVLFLVIVIAIVVAVNKNCKK